MKSTRWECQPVSRHALIWSVGATYFALSPHLLSLPVWISGLILATPVWRWLNLRGTLALPNRWLLAAFTTIAAVLVLMANDLMIGPTSGVQLLAVMTGLKVLETRRVRDAVLMVFLGYLLVVTRFFQSQSVFEGIYLLLSVLLLTSALLAINHPARAPGVGSLIKPALSLTAQALPGMLILFLLVPRLPGPLWTASSGTGGVTGISDRMSPGSVSQLTQSGAVAFRVRFTGRPPAQSDLYWRGPVLWAYDGTTWNRSDTPSDIRPASAAGAPPTVLAHYEITLAANPQPWMFALEHPVTVPETGRLTDSLELVHRTGGFNRTARYTLSSRLDASYVAPLSPSTRARALQLPDGANPRTRALARKWVEQGLSPAQRINQALGLFRTAPFTYTTNPPLLSGDRIDAFLFESRSGFCEHFASSFVGLMRAAGVPARIVTGYQGGQFNPMGDYMLVRQADAHAWAEVWIEDRGWTRVDPTAAVSPERVQRGLHAAVSNPEQLPFLARAGGDWTHRAALAWDGLYQGWNQWVMGFGPENQRHLMEQFGLDWFDWKQIGLTLATALGFWLAGLWLACLVFRTVPKVDPVSRAYAVFCRRMGKAGFAKRRSEGPMDYGQRLAQAFPDRSRQIKQITHLYSRLLYGSRDAPDEILIRRFRRTVASFRPWGSSDQL